MAERLDIRVEKKAEGYVLLTLCGDLDLRTLPTLRKQIDDLAQSGDSNVILDLEKTDYVDSSGLGFFVAALKKLRDSNGDLVLINLNEHISGVFKLIRLQSIINVCSSVEDAVKHLNKK